MNFNITAGMLVETPNGVATALHYLEGDCTCVTQRAHVNPDLALRTFGNGNGLGQAAVTHWINATRRMDRDMTPGPRRDA